MSLSQSLSKSLVLAGFWIGVTTVVSCSSSDDAADDDAAGGSSAGKGGASAAAGSSSGKAGTGPIPIGGTSGSSSGGAGGAGKGGSGGATAPECSKEADCGAGQACTDGKCVVKPCAPPPTAFQFKPATAAASVALAGSHNAWSTTASPLILDAGDGYWKGSFQLAAGTYQYKFVVDGATWLPDPANTDTVDDGFCGFNSQIGIGCDGVEPAQGVQGDGCPPQGAGGESSDAGAGGAEVGLAGGANAGGASGGAP